MALPLEGTSCGFTLLYLPASPHHQSPFPLGCLVGIPISTLGALSSQKVVAYLPSRV